MFHRNFPPTLLALVTAVACGSEDGPPLDGGFVLTPMAVDFGTVGVGADATRSVRVNSRVDRSLVLDLRRSSVTSDVFETSVTSLMVPAKGEASFDVRFTPTTEDVFIGTIEVADDSKVVELDVRGQVLTEDCFEVTPLPVEFGNVVVDTTDERALTLRNGCVTERRVAVTSEQNVKLCTSGVADPSTFCFLLRDGAIDADKTFVVPAGEQTTLTVQFTPRIAGTRERGSFILSTCEGAICSHAVHLDGLGIESGFRCGSSLDFGEVSPGSCQTKTVTCENIANEQITIVSWGLVTAGGVPSSMALEVEPPQVTVLDTSDVIDIDVTYCPTGYGDDVGTLGIETDNRDARLRNLFVPISGRGGGPDAEVLPSGCLNFGLVSTLAPSRRALLVSNVGIAPLEITSIQADTLQTGMFTAPGAAAALLQPGDAMTITVEFLPTATGAVESNLAIETTDPDQGRIDVCLRGEGVELPECNFDIVGGPIDFGAVPPGHRRHQSIAVYNRGTSDCLMTSAHLEPGTDSEFFVLGDPATRRIAAGDGELITLGYAPSRTGAHTGSLEVALSSPIAPFTVVSISGRSTDRAPIVSPTVVDFGNVEAVCRLPPETIRVLNIASTPMTIASIALTDVGPFGLQSLPTLPAVVPAGGTSSFELTFDPSAGGVVRSNIRITGQLDGNPVEVFAAVRGNSSVGALHSDVFDDFGTRPIDALMVVDNSGSTAAEHTQIAQNFSAFTQYADTHNIDYQIGITTAAIRSEMGRLVHAGAVSPGRIGLFAGPVANKLVTRNSSPSPANVFAANLNLGQVGGGALEESGFEAAFLALTTPNISGHNAGLLRHDARLALLFSTDEADQSPNTVDFYLDYVESLKGTPNRHLFSMSAIAGDAPGGCTGPGGSSSAAPRLALAQQRTGGAFESVCTSDWSATMRRLGDHMFGVPSRYPLSGRPVSQNTEVRVDGVLLPRSSPQGTAFWSYDSASNEVRFTPTGTPEPGSTTRITYPIECL